MKYPAARRLDLVEELHGHRIADPYRWLEDPTAPDTVEWSEAQDRLTREFLDALPGRDALRERVRRYSDVGSASPPAVRGGRMFFVRRAPGEEHGVLFVRFEDNTERVLVDPNLLSPDGTVTLDHWAPSLEGDRLAYQLSEGGDEESSLHVLDVATGRRLDGPIDRCRYSPVAWLPGGEELFYVRRVAPETVPVEEQHHRRVYRHRVGADAADDVEVFGADRGRAEFFGVSVSRDGRWLLVSASQGTAPRNDLYLADLHADGRFVTVQEGEDCRSSAFFGPDGRLYVATDRDAPRGRLALADPADPSPARWRDLIPQSPDAVLTGVAVTDDAVVACLERDAFSRLQVHDRETGAFRREIALPGMGTVTGPVGALDGGDSVWFDYTDYTSSPRVYRYSVAGDAVETAVDVEGAVDVKDVVVRQVFVESVDGTQVPLFVIHKQDLRLDGGAPTILSGYGGFNVSQVPVFGAGILGWVEAGGIYARACLRGGSEYGEEWHRAGMRGAKQNVFDDFAAAAEWLVAEGLTSPERLAISGGSNGGLLVGAALTQRPELFRAVVCSAPLLDMVRYEQFGYGWVWTDEYGRADVPEELEWLLSYSPYHHVRGGVAYPAVLFTLFDSDTRVDPMHGRKMCAALQHASASGHPVFLRRERDVGHGARAVSRAVELAVDTLSFLAHQLGLDVER